MQGFTSQYTALQLYTGRFPIDSAFFSTHNSFDQVFNKKTTSKTRKENDLYRTIRRRRAVYIPTCQQLVSAILIPVDITTSTTRLLEQTCEEPIRASPHTLQTRHRTGSPETTTVKTSRPPVQTAGE